MLHFLRSCRLATGEPSCCACRVQAVERLSPLHAEWRECSEWRDRARAVHLPFSMGDDVTDKLKRSATLGHLGPMILNVWDCCPRNQRFADL
jgi:hypothetical protein